MNTVATENLSRTDQWSVDQPLLWLLLVEISVSNNGSFNCVIIKLMAKQYYFLKGAPIEQLDIHISCLGNTDINQWSTNFNGYINFSEHTDKINIGADELKRSIRHFREDHSLELDPATSITTVRYQLRNPDLLSYFPEIADSFLHRKPPRTRQTVNATMLACPALKKYQQLQDRERLI
ncbi:hypothetical protein RF11_12528 [Thelohanellus kitauei]|uniref:Uncharacterized protein n=1 Tax=Thelohanellus kitauei TaxID=669202 RepID=A0A0C2IWM0_THEKT|nr:hypothetical protein RF11_12528 [Thelohanellus kitauei]